jgi:hypothetical protein
MVGDSHCQHDGHSSKKNSVGNCPPAGKEDGVPRHLGDECSLVRGDGHLMMDSDRHARHNKSPSRDGDMKHAMRNAKVCVSRRQIASCTESIEDNTALWVVIKA